MLRPLVYYEAPWSWRSLRPIYRGGHRCLLHVQAPSRSRPSLTYHEPIRLLQRLSSSSAQTVPLPEQTSAQRPHDTLQNNGQVRDGLHLNRSSLRRRLLTTLHSNHPERLLRLALRAFRDDELVRSLPPTTISQIFDSLRFDEQLAEHKDVAQILAPGAITAAQASGWNVRNIRQVTEVIHRQFSTLFKEWIANGHPLDLSMCKSFLRYLSAAGQAAEARQLRNLSEEHDIPWDTEAYNLFLEALCWEDAHLPDQFGELRVTPRTLAYRKHLEENNASQGPTTAVKSEAIDAFEEMMSKGHAADVQTFSLLMLAMGRIGDLEGVAATLNRIWGIDVSGLVDGDTSGIYFENDMQRDAPLYPNDKLLFVVAHIYGSNNSLSTALKVVDFIAQKYTIEISPRTWEELAKWTFVLGGRVGGTVTVSAQKVAIQEDLATGKVPEATFRNVWRMMTSARFQVVPSLCMFNWYYSYHYRRGQLLEMAALLRYGGRYLGLGKNEAKLEVQDDTTSLPFNKTSTELERLNILANAVVFLRWVRLILHTNWFESRARRTSLRWFHTVFIPNFVAEWGDLWFKNTFYALHFRSTLANRISFHREMPTENRTQTEVFALDEPGVYIARMKTPSFVVPFQEVTASERRTQRYERDVAADQNLRYKVPVQWYERADIGDWIWITPTRGVRVKRAHFEGSNFRENTQSGRKLVLPANALEHLDKDEATIVRQRLASQ